MYAHYFSGRGQKLLLITTSPSSANPIMTIHVEGKADARKRDAFYGAQPWNF